jgi:hypothetical protein
MIGIGAFSECVNLQNVRMGDRIAILGEAAFAGCLRLNSVKLPNSLKFIGGLAFDHTALTDVDIPASVLAIGDYTFADCHYLRRATIGDGVYLLGNEAFLACENLAVVVVGRSVTNLAYEAFGGCPELREVYFRGNAPKPSPYVFDDDGAATVYYLPGTQGWNIWYGAPKALWLPELLIADSSFGVRTNQFGFTIVWASGMTVVVEASTKLNGGNWQLVQTNTLVDDTLYFTEPEWTNYSSRFYRVRWQ